MELTKEGRKARNEYTKAYMKEWRKKNRDRVRQYNASYWNRRAKAEASMQ